MISFFLALSDLPPLDLHPRALPLSLGDIPGSLRLGSLRRQLAFLLRAVVLKVSISHTVVTDSREPFIFNPQGMIIDFDFGN